VPESIAFRAKPLVTKWRALVQGQSISAEVKSEKKQALTDAKEPVTPSILTSATTVASVLATSDTSVSSAHMNEEPVRPTSKSGGAIVRRSRVDAVSMENVLSSLPTDTLMEDVKPVPKRVRWRDDANLVEIRYYTPDVEELASMHPRYANPHEMDVEEAKLAFRQQGMLWQTPKVVNVSYIIPYGSKSSERAVQEQRESVTLAIDYLGPDTAPTTPEEPVVTPSVGTAQHQATAIPWEEVEEFSSPLYDEFRRDPMVTKFTKASQASADLIRLLNSVEGINLTNLTGGAAAASAGTTAAPSMDPTVMVLVAQSIRGNV